MKWSRRLFRRRRQEEELEKELSFHLDQHTNDLIAQGHGPEEARRLCGFCVPLCVLWSRPLLIDA